MTDSQWTQLEALIRHDPAGRGVASFQLDGRWLAAGHLRLAAEHLAAHAGSVAIVTGFSVFDGQRWTAETDGPPGALFLARALLALHIPVTLIGDAYCIPVLEAGCDAWGLPRSLLCEIPFEPGGPEAPHRQSNEADASPVTRAWMEHFFSEGRGRALSHLIAIERCGPSHTSSSQAEQPWLDSPSRAARLGESGHVDRPAPCEEFEREVPADSRNRCHNMRGIDVTPYTAKTHLLFEHAQRNAITTVGMADGGNELGMGSIAWETLRHAIRQGPAARVACRIAADFTLLAGVSNWAAYALAAGCCTLRGRHDVLGGWTSSDQGRLISTMVDRAGAVDGMTGRHEATVDGLPLADYLSTLTALLELLNRP